MKVKDLITYGEIAMQKFEGKENLKQSVTDTKETIRRLKLLSPVDLNREMSKERERQAKRLFKKLGINI